jgi:ribosome-associated toxin RatA of RatAB toxin-antitoxin module
MRIVKKIVLGLIILIAVFMGIGLLLPSGYKVERSTVINAPAEVVFDQVNDLKKNEAWSPWKDPTMRITYGPVTAGKGASSSWTSKDMGSGTQTIEESVPQSSIRTHLDFGDMGQAKAHWSFVPEGEGVKVTQGMSGDQGMNPVKRWFGLMMDNMIGPYFEKGLASLKQVSEARAAELKAQPAAQASAPVDSAVAHSADSAAAAAARNPADAAGAAAAGAAAGTAAAESAKAK